MKQRDFVQMKLAFSAFLSACEGAGLQAQDCGNGHWRITHGLVDVNYYPFSKRRTIWANGTTRKASTGGSTEDAIRAAQGQARTMAPGVRATRRPGQNWGRRIKRRWLSKGRNRCGWCMKPLTAQTMTVDHIIPLHRGGSNLPDNLTPACEPCNTRRGHELGAPK